MDKKEKCMKVLLRLTGKTKAHFLHGEHKEDKEKIKEEIYWAIVLDVCKEKN